MSTTSSQDLIQLEKKLLERQEKLEAKQEEIAAEKEDIEKKRREYTEKLEKVSGLTKAEAEQQLLKETEQDAAAMMAKILREREDEAKATADKKAQEVLLDSLKHGALKFVPEYTVS
ncbi:MAG TPA: Rnase Y domain-containing protein, partial [Patescibacteria group bacterium]|nr:Rnase Y domain-containing protein [Patescibacteria group bacterium]